MLLDVKLRFERKPLKCAIVGRYLYYSFIPKKKCAIMARNYTEIFDVFPKTGKDYNDKSKKPFSSYGEENQSQSISSSFHSEYVL